MGERGQHHRAEPKGRGSLGQTEGSREGDRRGERGELQAQFPRMPGASESRGEMGEVPTRETGEAGEAEKPRRPGRPGRRGDWGPHGRSDDPFSKYGSS